MTSFGIGAPVRRREDYRLLAGEGRFTDDVNAPGQAYAAFVRSPHAHADVVAIDAARGAGRSRACSPCSPGAISWPAASGRSRRSSRSGAAASGAATGRRSRSRHGIPLATDRVRHVGEPVAIVVARDAGGGAGRRRRRGRGLRGAARWWSTPSPPSPRARRRCTPPSRATAATTGNAGTPRPPRAPSPPPPTSRASRSWTTASSPASSSRARRSPSGTPPPSATRFTRRCRASTRGPQPRAHPPRPHRARALRDRRRRRRLRLEDPALSRIRRARVGGAPARPSAQVGVEPAEGFLTDAQSRDHVLTGELALDARGRVTALRVHSTQNLGAYVATGMPISIILNMERMVSGLYAIPAIHLRLEGAFTNTVPINVYRGVGRLECVYTVERLIERAARETGRDAVALRRLNMVRAFPYGRPPAPSTTPATTSRASTRRSSAADAAGFPSGAGGSGAARPAARPRRRAVRRGHRRRAARVCRGARAAHGHRRGPDGEPVAGPGPRDRLRPGGGRAARRPLRDGAHRPGRHRSGGERRRHVRVALDGAGRQRGRRGGRTRSSRGAAMAAHLLEAAADDVEFRDGAFSVVGHGPVDRDLRRRAGRRRGELPAALGPPSPAATMHENRAFAFANGCETCELEVDPETGAVTIAAWTVVDDSGRSVNPTIVHGQMHGAAAQGIGQALIEQCVYDPASGQLADGVVPGLRRPARRRPPGHRRHQPRRAEPDESARRQGRGRRRHRRRAGRRHPRHPGCARAARGDAHRHAGHAGAGVAGDPERALTTGGGHGDRSSGATRTKWLEALAAHKRDADAPGSGDYWSPSLDCASRDELIAIQNAKLAALTPFLYENSAFYRRASIASACFPPTSGPWTTSPSGRSSTRPR